MKKLIRKDTKYMIEYTIGKKSGLNLMGKIFVFPWILLCFLVIVVFDFLFTKGEEE